MPRTVTSLVYQFDELSDAAKARAREWAREGACADNDWYEFVLEDAATIAGLLGIAIDRKPYRTLSGGTGSNPAIFFSGFWSQGDGACFEGSYRYAKGCAKKIREHAPADERLHRIADELVALQKPHLYRLTAEIKHTGRYSHEYSTTIAVYNDDNPADANIDEALSGILRDFMRWIYRQLETEYEYQMSDEQIDDMIRANEYEFDADGRRA